MWLRILQHMTPHNESSIRGMPHDSITCTCIPLLLWVKNTTTLIGQLGYILAGNVMTWYKRCSICDILIWPDHTMLTYDSNGRRLSLHGIESELLQGVSDSWDWPIREQQRYRRGSERANTPGKISYQSTWLECSREKVNWTHVSLCTIIVKASQVQFYDGQEEDQEEVKEETCHQELP